MEFRVPELGEGVYEAELVEWFVQPGQPVRRGEALAEVMTDKATMDLPAPFSGTVEALFAEAGQSIEVGQLLLRYASAADGVGQREPAAPLAAGRGTPAAVADARRSRAPRQGHADSEAGNGRHRRSISAAPAVRKMALSLGIDLADVPGSGPSGRVLIDDLGAFVRRGEAAEKKRPQRATAMDLGTPGQRIKLQGVRRAIADHMVAAKKTIPHYSYIDECDVSELVALRNELKRPFYSHAIKLTLLPFYVKAAVAALKRVPIVNASLEDATGEIVLHDEYHIGIATATSKGLVVPVLRHADRKDLQGIAADIERLIRAAQTGSIARSDLRGGTFTISSVGNIGGLVSTPIIHHPEVAIVAIGKVFKRPVYNDQGDLVPARITYLSFSFDHRVVDGSVGALFGNAMIQHLKQPRCLVEDELKS